MMLSVDLLPEILTINVFTALKSSLRRRRKHVLRQLRLNRDQASGY